MNHTEIVKSQHWVLQYAFLLNLPDAYEQRSTGVILKIHVHTLQFPHDHFIWKNGKHIQYLDNNHLSSKPQHRWAEDGKEPNELWQMIINDDSQKYNHEPRDTDKLAIWVKCDIWL